VPLARLTPFLLVFYSWISKCTLFFGALASFMESGNRIRHEATTKPIPNTSGNESTGHYAVESHTAVWGNTDELVWGSEILRTQHSLTRMA
jgi:hypothetical protein